MVKANKKVLLGLLTVGVITNLQSNERKAITKNPKCNRLRLFQRVPAIIVEYNEVTKKGSVTIIDCDVTHSFDLKNLEILEHEEDDIQVGLKLDVRFKGLRINQMRKKIN